MNHFEPLTPWPTLPVRDAKPDQQQKKTPIPIGPTNV